MYETDRIYRRLVGAVADFPPIARRAAGYQLDRVQRGLEPDDWKPIKAIGQGVRELRLRDRAGAFRVIYLAALSDRIVVLHAFQKKRSEPRNTVSNWRPNDYANCRRIEVMARRRFASVWNAIEDTAAEADNMRARSELMIALRTKVEGWQISQTEAARRLGLTQPRLNDLMRGRIDKFSLDALVNLAAPAGLVVRLQIRKAA